jgi:FAD synthetase
MTVDELLSKYIHNTECVLAEMRLSHGITHIDRKKASNIVDTAKRYLEDAKYYQQKKRFETGLASVAYSEGLLDALRLLEIAKFQWPTQDRGIPKTA